MIAYVREVLSWYNMGATLVAILAFNKIILDIYIAHRLRRTVNLRATIAGYGAAITLSIFVLIIMGSIVLDVFSVPPWWWQPLFTLHIIALSTALHGIYAKLILPVSYVKEQIACKVMESDGEPTKEV